MRLLKRIISALGAAALITAQAPLSASAEKNEIYLSGKVYEYDASRSFKVSSFYYMDRTTELETLGKLSVEGDTTGSATSDNVAAFEVNGADSLTFTYDFNDSLYREGKFNWHIVEDSATEIDGMKLNSQVRSGAVMIETSPDRQCWSVAEAHTDIMRSASSGYGSVSYTANSSQLLGGCYFRVIVAYQLEEQLDENFFWFFDISDKDRKRVAEVYEFYAKSSGTAIPADVPEKDPDKLYVGETVFAGYNNGYTGSQAITAGNVHYGFEIGRFSLDGYAEQQSDNTLVKLPDQKVTLNFELLQKDLNALGGDRDLSIISDSLGIDNYFKQSGQAFGKGALIIRRTNSSGALEDPVVIPDFLSNAAFSGGESPVYEFDEGDYECALDYRINENGFFYDDQYDYKTYFSFKVRNSGCGIWLLDSQSGESLDNAVSTENGFRLDSSVSEYLRMKISLSQWVEKENGYTETHIFDRAPIDGEVFEQEGIYTITAVNPTVDPIASQPVIKRIYVGTDEVLRAYCKGVGKDITVNMIADCLRRGGSVADDGTLILPKEESSSENEITEQAAPPQKYIINESITNESAAAEGTSYQEPEPHFPIAAVLCAAGTVAAAVFFYLMDRENSKPKRRK